MSKSTGINKDSMDSTYRGLDFINDFTFMITLKAFKINTFSLSNFD